MAGHTPGPWHYDHHNGPTIVADRDGDVTCPTICDVLDTTEGLEGDDPQAEANGRLIAAAPDLLEACERFEAYYATDFPTIDAMNEAFHDLRLFIRHTVKEAKGQ